MSCARRLCSLETQDGIWTLSLDAKTTLIRAVVTDRAQPAHLLWRSRARLIRDHGRTFAARLSWRSADVLVRVEAPRRKVSITLLLPLDAAEPAIAPIAPAPALLERTATNPILQPRAAHRWESLAVLNAAAILLEDRVHLLYRAIGEDGLSTFGYASSDDGVQIQERSDAPVYTHALAPMRDAVPHSAYRSGISHAGCEDPRITRSGDRLYVTYTAFDGHHPPGVAVTSISVRDFLRRRWRWAAPVAISAPAEAHKNWVLFPERIGGRHALLHGISPSVQIEYLDDLDFRGGVVSSRYCCSGRSDSWDNRLRGVGPPPIRTAAGWLVLYHAMDERDPGRYKVGALLLDLDDPCRILGRLPHPLLEPDARYENEGCKRGVVYVCGAVRSGDRLLVYYGGADTVLCLATMPLAGLLEQIVPVRPRPPARPA